MNYWRVSRNIIYWAFVLMLTLLSITFFNKRFDVYTVVSGSMIPELFPGDILFLRKYGNSEQKLGKGRYKKELFNKNALKRDRVYIIEVPSYEFNVKYFNNITSGLYVKRCVGLPGEEIKIANGYLIKDNKRIRDLAFKNSKEDSHSVNNIYDITQNQFYPHDSLFLWNSSDFGPLYLPKKGSSIILMDSLIILYSDIMKFENQYNLTFEISNSNEYYFENDYYFFIGDNFYGSKDSRHWGLIPEENIVGEVKYIVWSKTNKTFLKKVK